MTLFDGSTRRSSRRRNTRRPTRTRRTHHETVRSIDAGSGGSRNARGARCPAEEAKDQAALAKALAAAKVSLEKAPERQPARGQADLGKFEIGDDGKLQLSVYTAKGDAFSEVIVDHATGKVEKAERSRAARTSRRPRRNRGDRQGPAGA